MKKIILGFCIAGASLGITSCNDFLDMTPHDRIPDSGVWAELETAEQAVNYLYSYVYDVAAAPSTVGMTEAFTDMFKYGSYNYNSLCFIPSEVAYGGSTLTVNYVASYLGSWSWYKGIRHTNEGIYSLKKYGALSEADALRLEAEMRFTRAFLYFDMVKRYKEVILYDEDMSQISIDKALSSEKECWDFIQEDLEFAAQNLPAREQANGRANKGMAYAFLSRTMLYAERWDVAKNAADQVTSLGYTLETNYSDAYMKPIHNGNNEAILQWIFDRDTYNQTHSFDFYYTPGGDYSLNNQVGGGYGTPTQEMVESYELATGGFPDWSAWHSTDGVIGIPPYAELEPRFHATILYNGASWKGRIIEPFIDGADGFSTWNLEKEPKGRTTTGYYLRKLVDETHDVINESGSVQPITIIRYGEVLLNKAEACYRSGDMAGANDAIRQIRARVGLPYADKSGDALWEAIRQERKVELAYEDFWYWDLRRWKVAALDYPQGLNGYQVHGMKIEKQPNGEFKYSYVSVDDKDRHFPEKMYRFPLPPSELTTNSLVNQFPEWN